MDMTICVVWLVLAIISIAAVVSKSSKRSNASDSVVTRPPPPVVTGIDLLKFLHALCRKDPEAAMMYLYNKLGSIFTLSFLWKRVTILIGHEASIPFFHGLESDVSQGNFNEFTVPMFGKENGYAVEYATRIEQSRFFYDSLKASQLRSHVDLIRQEVEEYFAKWGDEGEVDLKQEFTKLLMLIAGRCLLGSEVRDTIFGEFYTLFADIEEGVNLFSYMFPYMPVPVNNRRDRAQMKLTSIVSEIVRSRKRCNRVEDDMLQRLIDSRYKDGRPTTEGEVSGMIIGLIFAGKHTSTITASWTGACLLTHPKFLGAAVEEQKQMMSKYKDNIDYNILSEMEILHSCIKEAGRMYPAAPVLLRKTLKEISVQTREGGEYGIPKGTTLAHLVMLTGKVPHTYKDPEVYDPDRFRVGREEDKIGGKLSYTIFGAGRHACAGESFAFMQIKIIWSHLLRNFDLKLTSPFPKQDWSKFIIEPKGKVMVSYKRCRMPAN
uniref:Obtusifoliol 14-alpha demethylase n=3 Tax=Avena TaxID=4496 RepID=A1BQV1_9POAL|nr:cytochrome P450 CYP51H10 [Avena strigosa]ABG88965.1 cytochrome P450 CYP51H10 [Avena strigosa]